LGDIGRGFDPEVALPGLAVVVGDADEMLTTVKWSQNIGKHINKLTIFGAEAGI
jgi:hypothetical protein